MESRVTWAWARKEAFLSFWVCCPSCGVEGRSAIRGRRVWSGELQIIFSLISSKNTQLQQTSHAKWCCCLAEPVRAADGQRSLGLTKSWGKGRHCEPPSCKRAAGMYLYVFGAGGLSVCVNALAHEDGDEGVVVIKDLDVWEKLCEEGEGVDGTLGDILEGQLWLPGELGVVKVNHLFHTFHTGLDIWHMGGLPVRYHCTCQQNWSGRLGAARGLGSPSAEGCCRSRRRIPGGAVSSWK